MDLVQKKTIKCKCFWRMLSPGYKNTNLETEPGSTLPSDKLVANPRDRCHNCETEGVGQVCRLLVQGTILTRNGDFRLVSLLGNNQHEAQRGSFNEVSTGSRLCPDVSFGRQSQGFNSRTL